MRRKDKQIEQTDEMEAIIRASQVCRLGLSDGDQPYVVPLCFGYRDKTLYFHSAGEGRKIDILRKNPKVCVEFDIPLELKPSPVACKWSFAFQSVMGFGTAVFISDDTEKAEALALIMAQYSDQKYEFPRSAVQGTCVFKVILDILTGKS